MPRILIIALSARPYAIAAKQAGYQVTVIDGFADAQTQAYADEVFATDFDETGFIADDLLNIIKQLDTSQYQGFVYGSGFDGKPDLLQEISNRLPLIGNTVDTLKAIRHTHTFFNALQKLHIRHPQVVDIIPKAGQYLKKSMHGCGGTHISFATQDDVLSEGEYFQQYIEGRSVSLLFVACTNAIEVIGFNEQWVSESQSAPFRYNGAVGQVELAINVQQQLISAAQALTVEFGLKGLNSLDAIVANDIAYVLEVNPRLSATFDLHEGLDLFERHIGAAQGMAIEEKAISSESKAHAVIYAQKETVIKQDFVWPDWATDTPIISGSIAITTDQPICTVWASDKNSEAAKLLVNDRVKMLQDQLNSVRG